MMGTSSITRYQKIAPIGRTATENGQRVDDDEGEDDR